MGFQVVAFLPSRVSFCNTLLTNCGKACGLGTTTCLRHVVVPRPQHVLDIWWVISKPIITVKYFLWTIVSWQANAMDLICLPWC